jgi:hypothetical protein
MITLIKISIVKTVRIIIKIVCLIPNFLEIFKNLLSSGRNKEGRRKINPIAMKII